MWPDRRLMALFEIEHPLILAPMAGIGTATLAAGVCAGGGLGSISCAGLSPQLATRAIHALQGLTDRPINVNFFCHLRARDDADRERAWRDRLSHYYRELGIDRESSPPRRLDIAPFDDSLCGVVEDTRPRAVSFHFGLPAPELLSRVKAAGCAVMSSATTLEEALWLEERGVDVIIAQGYEAGGHRGMFLEPDVNTALAGQTGTLALVPQIVAAVRVPVVAAGGIADGRGIAAALALGAAGAQVGTAYLLCPEAATPAVHRDALRRARPNSTVLTNVFTGRPARVIANRLTREMGAIVDSLPAFPLPLGELTALRAKAEPRGSSDFTPLWSGQSGALGCDMAAEALTASLVRQAKAALR